MDRVLVLLPSLALVAQTADVWAVERRWARVPWLAVCSDTGELDLVATTDPDEVGAFMAGDGPRLVFGTYQSYDVLGGGRLPVRAHRCRRGPPPGRRPRYGLRRRSPGRGAVRPDALHHGDAEAVPPRGATMARTAERLVHDGGLHGETPGRQPGLLTAAT